MLRSWEHENITLSKATVTTSEMAFESNILMILFCCFIFHPSRSVAKSTQVKYTWKCLRNVKVKGEILQRGVLMTLK